MSYLPIYKTLKESPAVVAILGAEPRVYEDIAPVGAAVPYVVWQELGGKSLNYVDNMPADNDDVMYQLKVYDTNAERASDVRSVVRKALELYCYILNPRISGVDPPTKQYFRGFDASWIHDA
ncbi:tail completion protein gp17 [Acinetobacter pittii]|uniref:tail completion protein gp17 n=1 Tax=Acinetobacter pittii TaxID=48296 RepID=UPI00355C709E